MLQTFNTLCKMRKSEFGTGNGAKADDECQMADDECQMADDEWQSSGPLTEDSCDPVVGHDSNRVMDDLTSDQIGILSHESAHAAGQPGQGDGAGQGLPESKINETLPQKAPNEANLESTQSASLQGVESENCEQPQRERTQFAARGQVVGGAGSDRVETIVPAGKGHGNARGREGILLPMAVLAQRLCAARGKGPP